MSKLSASDHATADRCNGGPEADEGHGGTRVTPPLVLVTYASTAAPGTGGAFYVVAHFPDMDYQHVQTFSHSGSYQNKDRAKAAAERLADRVRLGAIDLDHCEASQMWKRAVSYTYATGERHRTWSHEIERAIARASE